MINSIGPSFSKFLGNLVLGRNGAIGLRLTFRVLSFRSSSIKPHKVLDKGTLYLHFFFIIMAKDYSRFINLKNELGHFQEINIGGTSILVTHSLFADDTLLFERSNFYEARHINQNLDLYTIVSGQG